MARYRLTIAYEGTDFHGWQRQDAPDPDDPVSRNPLRTVQHVVEQAIRDVVRQPIHLQGASRTDAGVHARMQTAAFTVPVVDNSTMPTPTNAPTPASSSTPIKLPVWKRLTDDRLRLAINSRLPGDVVIRELRKTCDDFEPISDCRFKRYRYQLWAGLDRPLWDRRLVHHVRKPLNFERMQDAAPLFEGEHDFAAYAKAGHGRKTTVRTVFGCAVSQLPIGNDQGLEKSPRQRSDADDPLAFATPQHFAIDISGDGFLHNMVRIIAGTIVEVGLGRMELAQIERSLLSGDRADAGPTLPAVGLTLVSMVYPGDMPNE